MDYGMAALTALMVFISPCVLPLLPVYVSYFAAGEKNRWRTLFNTLAFCAGISLFFMAIFISAAAFGSGLSVAIDRHKDKIFVICGIILILLGLKFMGYLNIPFLNKTININAKTEGVNIINAFLLGLAFSLSMGMCTLAFSSFNLIRVLTNSDFFKGLLIGVIFVGVIDILFIVCALLIDQLKGVFSFIKRHYKVINIICGGLMAIMGLLIALGITDKLQMWMS